MHTIKIGKFSAAHRGPVSLRCPACGDSAAFQSLEQTWPDIIDGTTSIGARRCPHPRCRAVVFIVWEGTDVLVTYPPQRIDFDHTGIPGVIVQALEEAIVCHAHGCYTASGIMVRKTLEILCDVQQSTGDNLKKRLDGLRSKVILPQDLMDGLDELRVLGNDAAHVESKAYDKIGSEEVEVGIAVAKEVLKAVYQHGNLVNRLRALKKP